MKHHANTYSQTHENIIINSQSFAKVCSIVTKSSSNVDGPSYIHGQFTSLEKCVFKLAQYYISRLVLGQAKLKHVFGSPAWSKVITNTHTCTDTQDTDINTGTDTGMNKASTVSY